MIDYLMIMMNNVMDVYDVIDVYDVMDVFMMP